MVRLSTNCLLRSGMLDHVQAKSRLARALTFCAMFLNIARAVSLSANCASGSKTIQVIQGAAVLAPRRSRFLRAFGPAPNQRASKAPSGCPLTCSGSSGRSASSTGC